MGACCSKDWSLDDPGNKQEEDEESYEEGEVEDGYGGARVRLNGCCCFASMYTQQGRKGVNQDAMTMWEDFNGEKGSVFCGVFDGHGPSGHRVASHVRDILPSKLSQELKPLISDDGLVCADSNDGNGDTHNNKAGEEDGNIDNSSSSQFSTWKSAFITAYNEMDKELSDRSDFDCYCSGATAVSILKQGEDLLIANLGDSRALLCKRDHKNRPYPVQLTIDLKPNVPRETERIESCQGRVFALPEEPDVYRIWMPDEDCPGLAMTRAFGDFCLKEYGLISTPQITYRRIADDDDFIVLATDGIWDVLPNHDVVKIVASCKKRSKAAKTLIDHAVRSWRLKYPLARADDCAVICLFLRNLPSSDEEETCMEAPVTDTPKPSDSDEGSQKHDSKTEWMALDVVTRANSVISIPRFANATSQQR